MIQRAIERVFEGDQNECKDYGFENVQLQFWAVETIERWGSTIKQTGGYLNPQTEEENLMLIDDTWLKLAQIMWTRDRKKGRNLRQSEFQQKQGPEWSVKAI